MRANAALPSVRSTVRTTLLLLAVLATTGCSGSAAPALSADDVAARYGYRASDTTLTPVYALVPEFHDPTDLYARDLLIRDCLDGVVEYTPKAAGPSQDPVDPRTHQWQLDEATAQTYGYWFLREQPPATEGVPADVELTDALLATIQSCSGPANARVGKAPERLLNAIEAEGWMAIEDAPEMEQAITAWRTCMAPVGLIDLPDEPNAMPPSSVAAPGDGRADTPPTTPTDREREVAVADARCRAEADYYGTELRLRSQAELTAIGRNLNEFEAVRIGYQEHQKRIDAVIAELG